MVSVKHTPLVLVILDGFGYSPKREGNAIALARTPHFDEWFARYPNTLIETSGEAVGDCEGVGFGVAEVFGEGEPAILF